MPLRRTAGLITVLLVGLTTAGAAQALDEAQLTNLSCRGLTVTQSGLPPLLPVKVIVLDPRKGRHLAEVATRAGASGRLVTRVDVSLRGLPRVDVEVEHDDDEYAETGIDLGPDCRPQAVITAPAPAAAAAAAVSPPNPEIATPVATKLVGDRKVVGAQAGRLALAGALALATASVGLLTVRRRRRRAAGRS